MSALSQYVKHRRGLGFSPPCGQGKWNGRGFDQTAWLHSLRGTCVDSHRSKPRTSGQLLGHYVSALNSHGHSE